MKDVVLPVLFRVSRLEGGLEYSTKKVRSRIMARYNSDISRRLQFNRIEVVAQ